MAAAQQADDLLAIAERYARRPALVVAVLAWLALAFHRAQPKNVPTDTGPAEVGRFVARTRARVAVGDDGEGDERGSGGALSLPRLTAPPGFTARQGALVARLVTDKEFGEHLTTLLARGRQAGREVERRIAAMAPVELDGIALGSHSPANKAIDALETREISLAGAGMHQYLDA